MKVGGGAKQNTSLKQDVQVFRATKRVATTQSLCPFKVLGKGEGPANKG